MNELKIQIYSKGCLPAWETCPRIHRASQHSIIHSMRLRCQCENPPRPHPSRLSHRVLVIIGVNVIMGTFINRLNELKEVGICVGGGRRLNRETVKSVRESARTVLASSSFIF